MKLITNFKVNAYQRIADYIIKLLNSPNIEGASFDYIYEMGLMLNSHCVEKDIYLN